MFDEQVKYSEVFSEEELSLFRKEYSRLEGICYLDHTGFPHYPDSLINSSLKTLTTNVYGNPHSGSLSSKFSLDLVDQVRYRVLNHFSTTPNEYSVIFTSGATAALKLVGECFQWSNDKNLKDELSSEKSFFAYVEENHTSVLGMRALAVEKGIEVTCLEKQEAFHVFEKESQEKSRGQYSKNSLFVYTAQSNFSGFKYPLDWIEKVHSGVLQNVSGMRSNWYCILDAATFVGTNKLDLSSVKPDFVAISFYKMFGFPTGLGALLVRNSCSHLLKKTYYGGGTVSVVLSLENSYVPREVLHDRFEDGTINFLSIFLLPHGFDFFNKQCNFGNISKHCFLLARYTYQCLVRLHHSNGAPAAVLYTDTPYDDITSQGNIVNFNLLRPNGEYIGFAEVLHLANLHNIHLRTGCFCNSGACRRHLGLSTEDIKKQYLAGHVCGDENDIIDGQPTGSVRVSFGPYSTVEHVHKFLNMIVNCFIQKPIIQKYPENKSSNCDLVMGKQNGTIREQDNNDYKLSNKNGISLVKQMSKEKGSEIKTIDPSKEIDTGLERSRRFPEVHLSHIFLYPVKSCGRFSVKRWELSSTGLRYDREWMITTPAGVALTQKTETKLCLIQPIIDLNKRKLVLTCKDHPSFTVDMEDQENQEINPAWLCSSKVCGDSIQGVDCGDAVSHWLSDVLKRDGLRLIRQKQRDSKAQGPLSLSNQAQYLMINKCSVDHLAEKLDDFSDCKKETMIDRFRSNFVISGLHSPFEEQLWDTVTIGNHQFHVDGPCGRCQMICVDQDTGEKNKEPLTILASTLKGKMRFGVYLSTESTDSVFLSIGDPVYYQIKS